MIIKKNDANSFEKQGVSMRKYDIQKYTDTLGILFQETQKGHFEEFYHEKSIFIYYIIEGSGTWVIEDEEYSVSEGDLVIIPPNKRFYYKGNLKQICITTPAWKAEYEHHIKNIEF